MRLLLITGLVLISMSVSAQITYVEGYIITTDSARFDGLIKDEGWRNNPAFISFRDTSSGEIRDLSADDIIEFGIGNSVRYIVGKVKIDESYTNSISALDRKKEPKFVEKILFLKVLVSGKASLYYYEDEDLTKYFYKIDGQNIEQLVYKKYKLNEFQLAENEFYKQQLYMNVRCNYNIQEEIERLEYKFKPLLNYVKSYNSCVESDFTVYSFNSTKPSLNITIKPGADYSMLNNVYHIDFAPFDFGGQTNFRLGVDIEYVFPFAQNKWSVFSEPTYRSFSSNGESDYFGTVEIQYTSLEIPLGLRYTAFLNKSTNLFADFSFVFDATLGGSFKNDMQVNAGESFAFGIGFEYKRYLIQSRYLTKRQLLRNYQYWATEFSGITLSLGYKLIGN